jgi:hypothetical protein
MQRRAKGQRRQPLSLPHRMEMAHAGDDDRAQRSLPSLGRGAGDRKGTIELCPPSVIKSCGSISF